MARSPQTDLPEEARLQSSIEVADLSDRQVRFHHRGAWGKADILVVEIPQGPAIVKDFGRKMFLVRWYGRWQIRREASIYRRLAGIGGVPRYYGRIGKNAMALEYIEGDRISRLKRREIPPTLIARLGALIDEIHSRGIVHIDLRKRDNILVTRAGDIYIIDFNASFRFPAGSWGARWIFPFLRKIDHFGFLKWKAALAPAELSAEERSVFEKMSFFRRFWIFK